MNMELLLSEREISEKVKEIASDINRTFEKEEILVIGVLKGALFFMADLLRELKIRFVYDFIQAKSYDGMESSGKVSIIKEPHCDFKDKNVLIVEDILDTGNTLLYLKEYIKKKGAKGVYICTLLDKKKCRAVDITPEFRGFIIEDRFVVGYGLDFNERMRELRDIFVIKGC